MQVPFLQTLDARALRFLIGRLSDPWHPPKTDHPGKDDPINPCLDGRHGRFV